MNPPRSLPDRLDNPDELASLADRVARLIAEYHASLASRPVTPEVRPRQVYDALPDRAPEHAEAWDDILDDVRRMILPALTHWQSGDFFGFFPSNASAPAALADFLAAGLGVQGMLWSTSPAATELEMRTLDWLARLIGLPESFTFASPGGGGVIQGTASEAVLTMLIAARHRAKADAPVVVYTSSQAHSSVAKAVRLLGGEGVGGGRGWGGVGGGGGGVMLRLIATDAALAMRPDALRDAMREDVNAGRRPLFCVATLGTTSTGAFDPIAPIAEACAEHSVFLHIDAAWAGAALVCPEHRHLIEGVGRADSFNFNPHKWLLTNFDCSCLWVRDRRALTDAMSVTPEYLRNPASESGRVIDYRDWHIPLGRRFRALKLWFVMRRFGADGLRAHIRRHIELAALFESLVRADERFEVLLPRSLALVCFTLRDEHGGDGATRALLERVNATRRAFLTHTVAPMGGRDRYLIRVAVGSVRTHEPNIRALWDLIRSCASPGNA